MGSNKYSFSIAGSFCFILPLYVFVFLFSRIVRLLFFLLLFHHQEYLEKESRTASVHYGVALFTELLMKTESNNIGNNAPTASPSFHNVGEASNKTDGTSLFIFGVKTRSRYLGEV
jgi:hypothetical protein